MLCRGSSIFKSNILKVLRRLVLNSGGSSKSRIWKKVEINGIDIAYKEAGSGSDIIMIHGIFASKEIMNPLFDYYKNDYPVISYDLRGHGESGKTENSQLRTLHMT